MIDPEIPIGDDELQAYVDDRLHADRLEALQRHLRANPDIAQRVLAYRAQRASLQAVFAHRAVDPIPASLNLTRIFEERVRARRANRMAVAAVLLAFVTGGAGGWFLHAVATPPLSTGIAMLAEEAVASHLVYSADRRRPVELWAAQRDDLAKWVSNRLNRPIAPPDLSSNGYHLMGGRLVATAHGPAALFMYDNQNGNRLSIFVRPMNRNRTTPITQVEVDHVGGCAWIDNGVGYTLVGAEHYPMLLELSQDARTQIDAAS